MLKNNPKPFRYTQISINGCLRERVFGPRSCFCHQLKLCFDALTGSISRNLTWLNLLCLFRSFRWSQNVANGSGKLFWKEKMANTEETMDGTNSVHSKLDKHLSETTQPICNCSGWNSNKHGVTTTADSIHAINSIHSHL